MTVSIYAVYDAPSHKSTVHAISIVLTDDNAGKLVQLRTLQKFAVQHISEEVGGYLIIDLFLLFSFGRASLFLFFFILFAISFFPSPLFHLLNWINLFFPFLSSGFFLPPSVFFMYLLSFSHYLSLSFTLFTFSPFISTGLSLSTAFLFHSLLNFLSVYPAIHFTVHLSFFHSFTCLYCSFTLSLHLSFFPLLALFSHSLFLSSPSVPVWFSAAP